MQCMVDRHLKEDISELFGTQEENIEKAARALKVMAHPVRLRILCVLRTGEQSVQCLAEYTGLAQATVSQHLSVLKDRGILSSRRDGNFSFYRIANDKILTLFELVKGIYCDPEE